MFSGFTGKKNTQSSKHPGPTLPMIPYHLLLPHAQQPYELLPNSLKSILKSSGQFHSLLLEYDLNSLTSYEQSSVLVHGLQKEIGKKGYYAKMLKVLREQLRLYPYRFEDQSHEIESPFEYYLEMLQAMMKDERSYDSLPNFTARDVKRLTNIGRNEYIDIMNKVRGKKWVWRFNKGIVKELLPTKAIKSVEVGYWWLVKCCPAEDIMKRMQKLDDKARVAYTMIRSDEPLLACRVDYSPLVDLYRQNLVYISVPIEDNDHIVVPPLKGFIMNRQPIDDLEKLLYDILVTVDERTSIVELASILERDVTHVRAAVSLCCRLGFAKKIMKIPMNIDENSEDQYLKVWKERIDEYHAELEKYCLVSPENTIDAKRLKRMGFLFDSSLTAYLMMGNLGIGLKEHAVTLFEVGKMPDEMLGAFLEELEKVDLSSEHEGEAQRYYIHAITLRNTLKFLRHNPQLNLDDCDGGVDLIRCESLSNLDPSTKLRILDANYSALIAMAPLASKSLQLPACIPRFYGPSISHVSSPWFKLYLYDLVGCGPVSMLFCKSSRQRKVPDQFNSFRRFRMTSWDSESTSVGSNILLQALNDALLHNPVLLQGFEESYDGTECEYFDVSFPRSSEEVVDEELKDNSVKNMMDTLIEKLNLSCSFGVVKFARIQVSESQDKIFPIDISFGIPLNESKINREVMEAIKVKQLFTKVAEHSQNMRKMCENFLNFIESCIDTKLSIRETIYPTRMVIFDGKSVKK